MDYIEWNKLIWNHFFNDTKNGSYVVLAASERVLKNLGRLAGIENPKKSLLNAVQEGPIDKNNPSRFDFGNRPLNILEKAHKLLNWCDDKKKFVPRGGQAGVYIWSKNDPPPYVAYLFFVILNIEKEDKRFWESLNNSLGPEQKNVESRHGQKLLELFKDIKERAEKIGCKYYCESIYEENGQNHYVGRIYSQLPLTSDEENEIIASIKIRENEIIEDHFTNKIFLINFINTEKKHLGNATKRCLSDQGSVLKEIVEEYFIENFKDYFEETLQDNEEINHIIATREINISDPNHVKFIQVINAKLLLREGFVTDDTIKNLGSSGNLELKKGNSRLLVNLGNSFQSDFSWKQEVIYFIENNELSVGDYRNANKGLSFSYTGYEISFPVFVIQEKNRQDLFRVIDDAEIEIFNQDLYLFSKKELAECKDVEFIKFIENDDNRDSPFYNTYFYKFTGESGSKIQGRTINNVNRHVNIKILGLNDGISGQTSFNCHFPIQIEVLGCEAEELQLWNKESETSKIFHFTSKTNNNLLSLNKKIIINGLSEGNYIIVLKDRKGKNIEPSSNYANNFNFKITDRVEDRRIEVETLPFYDEGEDILPNNIPGIKTDHSFQLLIPEEPINHILDHLIVTGSYNQLKFEMLFDHYVRPFIQENIVKEDLVSYRNIKKELLKALDLTGIVNKLENERFQLVKPYWFESVIENRNYIRGSLKHSERKSLSKDTSTTLEDNPIFFNTTGKEKIRVKIMLPQLVTARQQYEILPALKGDILKEQPCIITPSFGNNIIVERQIEGVSGSITFDEERNRSISLNVSETNDIFYYNWRKLRYQKIESNDDLNLLFSYSGIRLLKIEIEKHSHRDYYYFLFEKKREDANWKYTYYEKGNRAWAKFHFIQKIKYFDYTFDIQDANKRDTLFENFARLRARDFQKLYDSQDDKIDVSYLNYFTQINLIHSSVKKNLVLYDENSRCLGISIYLNLPSDVTKALIANSGYYPKERKVLVDSIDNVVNQIWEGNRNNVKVESPYLFFSHVSEPVANQVACNLLSGRDPHHFGDLKSYKKIELQ